MMVAIQRVVRQKNSSCWRGHGFGAGHASIMEPTLHLEQILEKNPEAAP